MKNKNTVPNIWTAQENVIRFYKILCIVIGTMVLVLTAGILFAAARDPIVVVKSSRNEFFQSIRAPVAIDKVDVEEFTKVFLHAAYSWSNFDSNAIRKEVFPYVEEELLSKFLDAQISKFGKTLTQKKLAQDVAFVKVNVLSDRVNASFMRVLTIDGIPLVIPMDVTLSVTQGAQTRANPIGVYVVGVAEHDTSK